MWLSKPRFSLDLLLISISIAFETTSLPETLINTRPAQVYLFFDDSKVQLIAQHCPSDKIRWEFFSYMKRKAVEGRGMKISYFWWGRISFTVLKSSGNSYYRSIQILNFSVLANELSVIFRWGIKIQVIFLTGTIFDQFFQWPHRGAIGLIKGCQKNVRFDIF